MSETAVVRIFATEQEPDWDSPWQARPPASSTGSGVVIQSGRILTGAHVVANSTFVQVQKISDPDKAIAHVVGICHDCDLALLEVEDPDFFKGVEAAEIGELPTLRDRVAVIGFPVGGDEVSVTEGVVSRIEVQRYSHSQRYLLAVTVDAAINQGNSGGPVFRDGKVVGIAFQKLSEADGIGELVPPPIIQHFLEGVQKTPRMDLPTIGVSTQNLENAVLRRHLGLRQDESGVLVLRVEYGSSAWNLLEPGDTILRIDGADIANNGTIRYRERYRTRYDVLLGEKHVGDTLALTILRSGRRKNIKLSLRPKAELVPRSQYDISPTYFIYAGLVFQTLSRDYLATWDNWWEKAPKEFLHLYYSGSRTPRQHEMITLSQVLADEINVGYESLYSESVLKVNGTQPRNMEHFVDLVVRSKKVVDIQTSSLSHIVFDTAGAALAQARILKRYHIEHDRSESLRAGATRPHNLSAGSTARARAGSARKRAASSKGAQTRKAASARTRRGS